MKPEKCAKSFSGRHAWSIVYLGQRLCVHCFAKRTAQ